MTAQLLLSVHINQQQCQHKINMKSLIYLVLLLYEAIQTGCSAFPKSASIENFRRDRLDKLGSETATLDYGGLYDLSFYRRDKNSKSSTSANLKTLGFTSPEPTEPRLTYDCPFYEWTNGVTNKKVRVMTREALEHYFNKDPLSLGNHETITSQAMNEECALFGPGWETLEIEEFGDFMYVLSFLLASRHNENVCSDPIGVDHIGAWGIALDAQWNASAGEWVWPRSGFQVVQGELTPWPWVEGGNIVPGSPTPDNKCNVYMNGLNWHEKQFSGCPGKGLSPWWQYKGDDTNRYPVPLILFSRPQHILHTNCHLYRGPNDETPPAELLIDTATKTDICANTLFCGGRGTEPGRHEGVMCEVAHDKMAVKYSTTNRAPKKTNLPNVPDPNAKIWPSQVCQKKPMARPREIFPNITRG